MKNPLLILLLLLFDFHVNGNVLSQSHSEHEKVIVSTDRMLYVTGEQILFSACVIPGADEVPVIKSVLYVELITSEGERITGGKFGVGNGKCNGVLSIPSQIVSGVYYLKSYTRVMRNFCPEVFDYVAIKIVNPDKSEIRSISNSENSCKATIAKVESTAGILLEVDKAAYSRRQDVDVSVVFEGYQAENVANMCLSVAPAAAFNQELIALKNENCTGGNTVFYQESKGITLTGKVMDEKTKRLLVNKRVNLSVLGTKDFLAMNTDSSGRFFFALPDLSSKHDLFISVAETEGIKASVLVDNDFGVNPSCLPFVPLQLNKDERLTAYNLTVNQKVAWEFLDQRLNDSVNAFSPREAFYGKPSQTLVIDKYIQLPSLEEYLNELPFLVKVRKQNHRKYFKVYGKQAEMEIYPPLVLVDFVAMDDPERVLAVSPAAIQKIELVNEPYYRGNMIYGGIVSIISKKNDFAGVDLPLAGMFINYEFYNRSDIPASHVPAGDHLPDARNTLLWIPDLKLNADGRQHISFSTADMPGTYSVVLKGVTISGEIIFSKVDFTVK